MDIATIVGILGCAAAVVYGIVNGDQGFAALGNFWDFSSVLVTIVGSMMCMVTMSESLGDFVSSLKSFALTIKAPKTNEGEVIHKIIDLANIARKEGLNAVAEGSNMDDNGDYRPGLQAVAELGVKSPLRHSELYKADIRALSKDLGLPTWEKQSFACLSSRFVYGETITKEKLGMVDKAEQLLLDLGFHQLRVRIHGTLARIEVLPDELQKVLENRNQIVKAFKEYGFTYVTMDLQGYRMGSMNETLKK